MGTIGKKSNKNWKESYKRLPPDDRSKHPLYRCYASMKNRCYNKNDIRNYQWYGGRGIVVCDRWLGANGFYNFVTDMGERPEGTSLERIDNDKGYEPSNCRWATRSEQARNRRDNLLFEGKGVREITFETNKHPETIRRAIRNGRDPYTRPEVWNKDSWKHGTISGYSNHGCRCTPCRHARNIYRKDRGWN